MSELLCGKGKCGHVHYVQCVDALAAERDLILLRAENAERALAEIEDRQATHFCVNCEESGKCRDDYQQAMWRAEDREREVRSRLAEAEALLREIYQRDRHFDSGAWLIRMYHDDYARIHALTNPDSGSGGEK